jgi:hypothetical protein
MAVEVVLKEAADRMRTSTGEDSRDGLSQVLRGWRVPAEVPSGFRRGVWVRIEARARDGLRQGHAGGLMAEWIDRVRSAFRRPALAIGFVVVLLVAGGSAGALSGQARAEALAGRLQDEYVQSVDPFAGRWR